MPRPWGSNWGCRSSSTSPVRQRTHGQGDPRAPPLEIYYTWHHPRASLIPSLPWSTTLGMPLVHHCRECYWCTTVRECYWCTTVGSVTGAPLSGSVTGAPLWASHYSWHYPRAASVSHFPVPLPQRTDCQVSGQSAPGYTRLIATRRCLWCTTLGALPGCATRRCPWCTTLGALPGGATRRCPWCTTPGECHLDSASSQCFLSAPPLPPSFLPSFPSLFLNGPSPLSLFSCPPPPRRSQSWTPPLRRPAPPSSGWCASPSCSPMVPSSLPCSPILLPPSPAQVPVLDSGSLPASAAKQRLVRFQGLVQDMWDTEFYQGSTEVSPKCVRALFIVVSHIYSLSHTILCLHRGHVGHGVLPGALQGKPKVCQAMVFLYYTMSYSTVQNSCVSQGTCGTLEFYQGLYKVSQGCAMTRGALLHLTLHS